MKVKVKFPGALCQLITCSEIQMELSEGSTLQELVQLLMERFSPEIIGVGDKYQFYHFADYVAVTINDVIIFPEDYSQRILREGDTVAVVPLVAGG